MKKTRAQKSHASVQFCVYENLSCGMSSQIHTSSFWTGFRPSVFDLLPVYGRSEGGGNSSPDIHNLQIRWPMSANEIICVNNYSIQEGGIAEKGEE